MFSREEEAKMKKRKDKLLRNRKAWEANSYLGGFKEVARAYGILKKSEHQKQ